LDTTEGPVEEPRALQELAARWRHQAPAALPGGVVDGLLDALRNATHINGPGRDHYADTLRRKLPPGWPLAEQVGPALVALDGLLLETLTTLLHTGELGIGRVQAVHSAFAVAREVLGARAPDDPHVTVERALAARDRQLSIATHELRTPISSIQLNLQLLERTARAKETLPSATVLKLLDIPTRQVRRLAHMVDRLLDAAQVESDRLVLYRERVDLCALVHEVGRRLDEMARAANCRLVLDDCESVEGDWDRLRLEQVVGNLLTNAIKYGGGQVRVATSGSGGQARLQVIDQGVGIAPADRERIFEPYERLGTAAGEDGAGLGLYIVREIVRAHGGQVGVDGAPGAGTTFTVTLPI
jgi:signal transduction histidine kinase